MPRQSGDFAANLRLLCSYGRSVSAICRAAQFNRHQLQRYLSGTSEPSLHSLRRICDYFGLEEHEILLPRDQFQALIRIRPPKLQRFRDRLSDYMGEFVEGQDLKVASHYEGYYHVYFQPNRLMPEIHRALTRLTIEDRCLITKTIERYPSGSAGLPRTVKYSGIAYVNGAVLTVIERRPQAISSAFFTVLYGADQDTFTYLSGLVMGSAPDASRSLYCLRCCWHYLGTEIDLRKRITECGQFQRSDKTISKYVRFCTQNDLGTGDEMFSPHF
jgi:transcriptional regulator with XRE-family HTH domain